VQVPFTAYDFFAYLASGGVVVAATDFAFGSRFVLRDDIGVVPAVLLLLCSYVVGHAVAQVSAAILESWFAAKVLGRPTAILMGERTKAGWRRLFPLYFRSLELATQERIRAKAIAAGAAAAGEGLFAHAFGAVKQSEATLRRLEEFRNLYGFCRNLTIACLWAATCMLVAAVRDRATHEYVLAFGSCITAIVLLYRYLKFFRQFAFEMLISYAELRPPDSGKA
jgi:hypothetical protein